MPFRRKYRKSRKRRSRKARSRVDKVQNRRLARLESNTEKKFDIWVLNNIGETGIPNSQPMSNALGSATAGYDLQIRDCTPVINQGLTDLARVGDVVELVHYDFRVVCSYKPTATAPATGKVGPGDIAHCRVMLLWDNNPTYQGTTNPTTGQPVINNNVLSWNHLLGIKPNPSESPAVALAPYNQDIIIRDKRCTVLFDKMFDMVSGTDRSVIRFGLDRKMSQKLKYLAAGSKVINRQLKFCFMSNRPDEECPHVYAEAKAMYTDL